MNSVFVEWSSIPTRSFNARPWSLQIFTPGTLPTTAPSLYSPLPSPSHHLGLPSAPPPMGNFVSCQAPDGGGGGGGGGGGRGKVVLSDGTVQEFDRPISVAEIMLEHPRQFVVDMQSLSAGATRVTPLPADHTLDPNKAYLMLPMTRGKLPADEARRILSLARSVLRSRSPPSLAKSLSLIAGICMAGVAAKEKEEMAEGKDDRLMEREEKVGGAEWSPDVFGAVPAFLSRQFTTKGWRPSLRTIEERALARKVSHWLF